MARYRLRSATIINHVRYPAGTAICDNVANKQPGDVLWTGLNAGTLNPGMEPLDTSGTTQRAGSRFSQHAFPPIDGANSIEG